MGLAAGFKQFVSARLPNAVLPSEPSADAVLTDAPCVLHSFSCDARDPLPAGHMLFMRMKRDALEGVPHGGTAVVCFDRHAETPLEKAAAHKKRRQAAREWTAKEVEAMLEKHELPRGDDWKDLLAAREVREVVTAYLGRRFQEWYLETGHERLGRLVIHNGGQGEPVVFENGARIQCQDAPRAGEADLALVLWCAWLRSRCSRVLIRTVDTDVLAIASLHDVGDCAVSLTHHNAQHRLCVNVASFRSELQSVYKMTPTTFVAIAVAKGCDFALPTLSGIPDWHDTLRLCGPPANRRALFVNSKLDVGALLGVLRTAVVSHKRAKIARSDDKHKESVVFAVSYWIALGLD